MKKVLLNIVGMHCASCVINIDGDLEDTEGIIEARTNFAKSQTEVTHDPRKISEEEIIALIKKTGYTAELVLPQEQQKVV